MCILIVWLYVDRFLKTTVFCSKSENVIYLIVDLSNKTKRIQVGSVQKRKIEIKRLMLSWS